MTFEQLLAAHEELAQGYANVLARLDELERVERAADIALSDRLAAINQSLEDGPTARRRDRRPDPEATGEGD